MRNGKRTKISMKLRVDLEALIEVSNTQSNEIKQLRSDLTLAVTNLIELRRDVTTSLKGAGFVLKTGAPVIPVAPAPVMPTPKPPMTRAVDGALAEESPAN
jgi:hypothetical protein